MNIDTRYESFKNFLVSGVGLDNSDMKIKFPKPSQAVETLRKMKSGVVTCVFILNKRKTHTIATKNEDEEVVIL